MIADAERDLFRFAHRELSKVNSSHVSLKNTIHHTGLNAQVLRQSARVLEGAESSSSSERRHPPDSARSKGHSSVREHSRARPFGPELHELVLRGYPHISNFFRDIVRRQSLLLLLLLLFLSIWFRRRFRVGFPFLPFPFALACAASASALALASALAARLASASAASSA